MNQRLKTFMFALTYSLAIAISLTIIMVWGNRVHAATLVNSDEHIVWQRAPITVNLPVGTERFVTFPSKVQFGYNQQTLPPSILRVENDDHTLYLTANKPFATQRVEAKLANGDIILLDLSASTHGDAHPLDIVLPSESLSSDTQETDDSSHASVTYASLMRYAVQQLYAPKRLLKASMLYNRFPMESPHIVPLFYDNSVTAMPLASWRGQDLYVTAVLVKNNLRQWLRLNPKLLCGDFKAASFFPQMTVAPLGTSRGKDTSTLFVVSSSPFADSIRDCLT